MAGYPQAKKCCCKFTAPLCSMEAWFCLGERIATLTLDIDGGGEGCDASEDNGTYPANAGSPYCGSILGVLGFDGWFIEDACFEILYFLCAQCQDLQQTDPDDPEGVFFNLASGAFYGHFQPVLMSWNDFIAALNTPEFSLTFHAKEDALITGTATVTFIGSPGCEECKGDPPTVSIAATHLYGCRYEVVVDAAPSSEDCPLSKVLITGPSISLEVPIEDLPKTIEIRVAGNCGEQTGEITATAIDTCGCYAQATESYSCCNCDDDIAVCDSSTPSLVLFDVGETSYINCPMTSVNDSPPCGGWWRYFTCDLTLGFSWPKHHACGSFALVVEFDGDFDGGGSGLIIFGAGGPDPDTGYAEFTLTGVRFGYAKHICIKAYLIAVSDDLEDDILEELPIGCDGPAIYELILNDPYYPGNSTWGGSGEDCGYEYVHACPPPT